MDNQPVPSAQSRLQETAFPTLVTLQKKDADYVFFELTRSICPECRRVIDAHILLRENKVYMRKRCPEHGIFEGLVYGDAQAYTSAARFNKPGTIPLAYSTDIQHGCPHDCGLCPDHQQHACLGIIEVNSACNMDCPLCFANAGAGFNLTLEEVEGILDHLVETEGNPEVVQFSGGEPTIHPQIIEMIRAAKQRNIRHVMLNTNGKRISDDDAFLDQLRELCPSIYFQFDGFSSETYRLLRGEPDILPQKLRALDRLADGGMSVILVPAIDRNVNLSEVGEIVRFAIKHPAIRGINFQAAFQSGRHGTHDPMQRLTIPDILQAVEEQTEGLFAVSDFVPVPCCFPTCNSVTYALIDGENVLPLPRVLNVEDYLDYVTNRVVPDLGAELQAALEGLWSSSAVPGSDKAAQQFALSCAACGLPDGLDLGALAKSMFVIMLQDFMDPWTFNQKNLMKCCKEILLPDGKQIPFCAYNNVGYREQARLQLQARERQRNQARRAGVPYTPTPLTFSFDRSGAARKSLGGALMESKEVMNFRPKIPTDTDAEEIKTCCAAVYQSDWARQLLGEAFHPGGTELTRDLGAALRLGPGQRVLDVAAGPGTSAIVLAQHFGCTVLGVDYGHAAVEQATHAAQTAGVAHLVTFEQGDAERLPVADESFDAVICECAFCTFPHKSIAAGEFRRVLRPGGKVGLSDLTRQGEIPEALQGLLAWIACIADAQPLEEYVRYLTEAGLVVQHIEQRDDALSTMVREIQARLLGAELLVKLKKIDLPDNLDFEQARAMTKAAAQAIKARQFGYAMLTAMAC